MLNYKNITNQKLITRYCSPLNYWIDIINTSKYNSQTVLVNICQQHHIDKRWILIVDPQEKDINSLRHCSTVIPQKILQVHSNKKRLSLSNIQKTLSKGNCAAVILCNAHCEHQQLLKLNLAAQQGKTHCVVLNNTTKTANDNFI